MSLPEYARPPVVEVALAVEFGHDLAFRALHTREIADAWVDVVPIVLERPHLPRMTVEDDGFGMLEQLLDAEEWPPRLWMQNDTGEHVVQVQHNRLVVNWRKGDLNKGTYPRYKRVRPRLVEAWERLEGVCDDLKIGRPSPYLCEMQYLNRMRDEQGWRSPEDTAKLIAPWHGLGDSQFWPSSHMSSFGLHCHFPDEREGWLSVDGWADSDELELQLTARGRALAEDLPSALGFFDVAHEWIVRGFTEVTTETAHKIWDRAR